MQDEQNKFVGLDIELSENKHYLELENTICYYNYPNANGREMDYGETEEEQAATLARAQTLVNMPVKAKYATNAQGLPTFKGHEAKRLANGEIITATEKIGTHTKAWIEEKTVVTFDGKQMTLPCLVAKQVVWKDNKNVVAAIKRLFSLGKLNSSWEVDVSNYEYKDGIKYLKDYSFLGNAYLGYEYAQPAYGQDAKVISIASQEQAAPDCDYEMMIAEALSKDLIENEVNKVKKNKGKLEQPEQKPEAPLEQSEEQPKEEPSPVIAEPEQSEANESSAKSEAPAAGAPSEPESSEQAPEQKEPESEQSTVLTDWDIRTKLDQLLDRMVGHGNIMFHFPEQHIIWYHKWDELDTQFTQIAYQVEDGDVFIVSQEPMQFELPVQELLGALAEKDKQLAEKDQELSELRAYKEQHEQAEAEAQKAQHEKDVASLRKLAEDANCFSEEELTSAEMAEMFEGVKTAEIKAAIFDRKMSAPEMSEREVLQMPRQMLESDDRAQRNFERAKSMRSWLARK